MVKKSEVQKEASKVKTPPNPKPEVKISAFVRSMSSNLASITAVTIMFPLEVVKTRMQIQVSLSEELNKENSVGPHEGREDYVWDTISLRNHGE